MKKIKIFGIGAAVLMILIAIMPFGTIGVDWGNYPDSCTPPPNPPSRFLGSYEIDVYGIYKIVHWVSQEFGWALTAEETKLCDDSSTSKIGYSITQKDWQEVTVTLEAQFSFLGDMFSGGGSIGETMGFSEEETMSNERNFTGKENHLDIGQYYKKQTWLKVTTVIYMDGGSTPPIVRCSDEFDLKSVCWRECHYPCPLFEDEGEEIHNDVNGGDDCQDCGI